MRGKIVVLALFVLRKIRESGLACGGASTFISRLPTTVEVACSGSQIVRSEQKSGRTIEKKRGRERGGWDYNASVPFRYFLRSPAFLFAPTIL